MAAFDTDSTGARAPALVRLLRAIGVDIRPGEGRLTALLFFGFFFSLIFQFHLPSRAIVGQAFQQAKINFFKALIYHLSACDDALQTQRQVETILEDAVYIRLEEELLVAYLTNSENSVRLKREAAKLLLPIWEHRQMMPMESFARLLLSAWRARCRLRETFGTLVGVQEVFTLMGQECESQFLDFFAREVVTDSECEAFREFLFGLAHEDLQKLTAYMDEHAIKVVGPAEVWRILGHPPPPNPDPRFNAEAVYASYRRRRVRAEYRVLSHAPGPHKTAEGYIMEYHLSLLSRQIQGSDETKGRKEEAAKGREREGAGK